MSEASSPAARPSGPFRWVHVVDDAIFAAEKAIVVAFLIGMTVMVFLDVVYRRLISPDSKIGEILAVLGGVDDPATRQVLDTQVAPWVAAALGLGLLWFAFWTAERHSGKRILPIRHSPLVLAVLSGLGITGLGWLMLNRSVPSQVFYLVLYTLVALAYVAQQARQRPPGWGLRVGMVLFVVTPLFAYVALNFMPIGFSWSKELSLIMLLWIGFLGASICAHEGKHLRMEAFDRILPPAATRWIHAVGFLVTAAFCALMGWLGYEYIFGEYGAYELGGVFEQTQIPDWVSTFAVLVGFSLATLRFLGAAVSRALNGTYGMPPVEESLTEAQRATQEGEVGAAAADGGHYPEQMDEVRQQQAEHDAERGEGDEPGSSTDATDDEGSSKEDR